MSRKQAVYGRQRPPAPVPSMVFPKGSTGRDGMPLTVPVTPVKTGTVGSPSHYMHLRSPRLSPVGDLLGTPFGREAGCFFYVVPHVGVRTASTALLAALGSPRAWPPYSRGVLFVPIHIYTCNWNVCKCKPMYLVLHRGIGATSAIAAEVAVEHGAKREQGRAARPKSDRECAGRAAASGMHLGCEEFLIATGHLCIKSAGGRLNVVQQTHLQMLESEASSVATYAPIVAIDKHCSIQQCGQEGLRGLRRFWEGVRRPSFRISVNVATIKHASGQGQWCY
ncbi:hypothetical protein B0H11DRAFT_1932977 [Mycena galericulata]|nr:hypothetical protein B0H11DRAFT_1932977 [Mycena galericulata]